ncbi:MAG: holo-ACP synthase [Anaerolineaceae bacterium]|nr:holo-ACP synthase [Anaerolineaceae bacterium]
MIYTGIDLVEIERFTTLDPTIRRRFYMRVFTMNELKYIQKSFSRAAGIFAAKEAVAKALGCGIGPISWQDIHISHTDDNQPLITLHGKALEKSRVLKVDEWAISITHSKKTAAAIAIAVTELS